jgi:hypothetical protein
MIDIIARATWTPHARSSKGEQRGNGFHEAPAACSPTVVNENGKIKLSGSGALNWNAGAQQPGCARPYEPRWWKYGGRSRLPLEVLRTSIPLIPA